MSRPRRTGQLGRPVTFTPAKQQEALRLLAGGNTAASTARQLNVCRLTITRLLKTIAAPPALETEEERERRRVNDRCRRYDITSDDYQLMLAEQGAACAICRRRQDALPGSTAVLAIDHCHATGQVRGLLCRCCNAALGHFADNTKSLRNAIEYLERNHA